MTSTPDCGCFPMARPPPPLLTQSPAGPLRSSSISMTGSRMQAWFHGAWIKPSQRSSSSPARSSNPSSRLEPKHVQAWIDALINPDGEPVFRPRRVNRKLSELRSYWRYLQSHQVVPEDRLPFDHRRVKDPPHRRKTKEDRRQRFQSKDIVRLWLAAERRGDLVLSYAIRIAAYSGARLEGPCELKATDIRVDPDTRIEFMRMCDKTEAGAR